MINKSMWIKNLNVEIFGAGYPLVFVHGGMGLDHNYFKVEGVLKLVEFGFQVILFDLSGNGLSNIENGSDIGIDSWISDIAKVVDELKLKKFGLIGHSYGALLSLKYARKYTDNHALENLILISPPKLSKEDKPDTFVIKSDPELKKYMGAIWNLWQPRMGKNYNIERLLRKLWRVTSFDWILPKKFAQIFNQINFRATAYNVGRQEIKKYTYDALCDFNPQIKTLILCGATDHNAISISQGLISKIKNAQIKIIDNATHFPFIEMPEKFIDAFVDFVKVSR